jgi:P-type Mg2+ transporter
VAIVSYLALIEVGKHWFYRSYRAPAVPAPRHRTPGHRVRRRTARSRPHSPARPSARPVEGNGVNASAI